MIIKNNLRKIVALLGVAAVTLSSFSACGQKNESSVNITLGSEPNTLDPTLNLPMDARSYISCLFEGLVNLDKNGSLTEGIAESWNSNSENTVYTFTIREDALWSNGEKITSEDFKYSWLRVLNPETGSGLASFLYYIKNAALYNSGEVNADEVGISTPDERTIVVEMESPCAFFDHMVATQPYFPVYRAYVEEYGVEWINSADSFVSNGAFVLKEWNHNQSIVLDKNPKFWNASEVKSDMITFELLDDSSVASNAFETKQLSYVENVMTYDEMAQISSVQEDDSTVVKFLSMNLGREKFYNKNVREAITIALDREQIANYVGDGAAPLCSFIPYGFQNDALNCDFRKDGISPEQYVESKADISKAKKLLADAGYTDSNPLKIDYLTNTSSQNVLLAEIIKSQLEQAGIDVNIVAVETKVFNDMRADRDYDVVASSWAAEYPDISSFLYEFQSHEFKNYAEYENPEYDALYAQLLQDSSDSRMELVHRAEDMIMNDVAAVPLFMRNRSFITNDGLNGYYHDITGCTVLKYVWEE